MARNNYSYEKYQREQAKKKKREAKRLKKLNRALGNNEEDSDVISKDAENTEKESETAEDN